MTRDEIRALVNRLSRTIPAYARLLADIERDERTIDKLESLQATTPLELIRILEGD